ncbi:uncharacterized protein LOC120979536 [Bufo bufo]|uniref:uncharacterized protein LOC120979536 n=1 Tax=Bufo bufo TaxID=8384 RepID=UPI001ABDC857|nr:uncharacterized protein LOC120979536 [Bufo bufo]
MRSILRPDFFPNNPDFCSRFAQISNKYSLDIILLNVEYLHKEICTLKISLEQTEGELKAILTTEDAEKYFSDCNLHLEKLKQDLQSTKRKKWQRDMEDYTTGFVYSWQGGQRTVRKGPKRVERPSPQSKKTGPYKQRNNSTAPEMDDSRNAVAASSSNTPTTTIPFLGLGPDPIGPDEGEGGNIVGVKGGLMKSQRTMRKRQL